MFVGREHQLAVRVYYEDTDFTGVVYHANYVRYFERGRSDFLRLAGVSHSDLLEGDQPSAFVVTRLEVDFRRPARIDDALLVRTTYDTRGEDLIAAAEVHAACIDLQGRPRRPPQGLPERLKPWLLPRP